MKITLIDDARNNINAKELNLYDRSVCLKWLFCNEYTRLFDLDLEFAVFMIDN